MSGADESPTRLAREAGTPEDDRTRARARELLRLAQTPPPRLSPAARARIVARLDADGRPVEGSRRRFAWPAVAVALLVLFAGGAVGAAYGIAPVRRLVERLGRGAVEAPDVRAAAPAAGPTPLGLAPAEAPQMIVTAEQVEPAELVPAVARVPARPAPRRRVVAEATPAAEPSVDPIVAESKMLADALTALRQRRDPQQALRALDAYDQRFPAGSLALEAGAARIDALLALGRRSQALQRLDVLPLDRVPRAAELRVLRGELRAGRGRLDEAVSDFSIVLSASGAPASVVERALYGRGSCRARLGDAPGARDDLREVVRRFPSGALAGAAERALRD